MDSFAIGVDLGGTNLRIAAISENGTLLEKISSATEVARGRDHVIDEMCNCISSWIYRFSASRRLTGIGIGVPGIIDLHTGMVCKAQNLPDWRNYPVKKEIERRLDTPVILENDANAACLGEKWLGAGMYVDDLCMLTLGTGVGGGMVLQGKIWHGTTGMAAELGHISVDPNGVPCGCGNRGCLEQYASATAVTRMARELVASGKAPDLARAMSEEPQFDAQSVYRLAMQEDVSAKEIFNRMGEALGIVLASLVNIFNLPMYLVGGGVANAWQAFAPAMVREVRKRSLVYSATTTREDIQEFEQENSRHSRSSRRGSIISRALLGGDAGLFGAARLPMITARPGAGEDWKTGDEGRIVA